MKEKGDVLNYKGVSDVLCIFVTNSWARVFKKLIVTQPVEFLIFLCNLKIQCLIVRDLMSSYSIT
jgi:hypothetical protein